jgi:C4-dicarboxylate-specific signal transduction histidine kinase
MGHSVINEAGDFLEFVGTVADITERKRSEEALRMLQTELANLSRVKMMGELAASIAHEINQPLGAIANNGNACLHLLGSVQGVPDDAREALTDIVYDANRASAIIARIRRLAKDSVPEKTWLHVKDIVSDVLALAGRELTEHRINVETRLPQNLPRVAGDRVQLQQVVLNLVINAIEAMRAVPDARRILTIRGTHEHLGGSEVRLEVEDLGIGFTPADAERLFEAFYTTKLHGMGMGLRISRSIVEAHGGRLWARGSTGTGASFYCVLPAQPPHA